MQYTSTRDSSVRFTASQAITQGLSADGGLLTPYYIPKLPGNALDELKDMPYQARAVYVMKQFLEEFTVKELTDFAAAAYGPEKFDTPAVAPVHTLNDSTHCLELWHGPTCAFKDMALQMLPHLLTASLTKTEEFRTVCILVATSGDTGKGALEGFKDVKGTRILVFYPKDGVSAVQELQMVTQEGDNVGVASVIGNFDDAQTGVKKVFGDKAIAAELEQRGIRLSSANSINWGRLVPQIVYYFYSYAQLAERGDIAPGAPVSFCVPTGNFGDILAGYYAKRMGLPVEKLICASNKNNVLTDFLTTGVYDARRTFYKTSSPSMDILVSSNLERLLYHVTQDAAAVAGWMRELAEHGHYTVPAEVLSAIRETFACGCADDAQVREEIRARYEADGYLCDTHTAVAFRVARQQAAGETPCVVLSTASPYKFPCDVLGALGADVPEDEFEAMRLLQEKTGVPAPASLAGLREKPVRFTQVVEKDGIRAAALAL